MRSIVTQQTIEELQTRIKELEAENAELKQGDSAQLQELVRTLKDSKARLEADFQTVSEQLAAIQNQGGSTENQEGSQPPAGEGGEGNPAPTPAPGE